MVRRSVTSFVAFALVLLSVPLTSTRAMAAGPSDLFFSEYVEGTSNNKALEIFNGTGAPIDLAAGGYTVQMCFNGSTTCSLTITLAGTVAANDVFVLAQSAAAPAILAVADQTNGSGWFNGDDVVLLRKGTTVIDSIGQLGVDPGTEWGTGLTSTADNTLRRIPTIGIGDVDPSNPFDPAEQWLGYATDTFDGLGSHTFTGDTPLAVNSITPAGGVVPLDTNVVIAFSRAVTLADGWYSLVCSTSGSHTATVTGGPTYTLDPVTDLASGEQCTITVNAAKVTAADDPTLALGADASRLFNTDAAPSITTAVPADGATNVPIGSDINLLFSEGVLASGSWFAIDCSVSGSHDATVFGSAFNDQFRLDPTTDFARGETCTVTVRAADVRDTDGIDPPDHMSADAVLHFATTPAPSPDLFFSEYIEGTSNNKALEIYNGTEAPVDLGANSYSIQMFFNGSTAAGLTIPLSGVVGVNDVFVIAQASANAAILAQADLTNASPWFNGDDAIVLRKGTTIVDVIGQVGFDPGTEWGSGLTSTADNTLRRNSTVIAGDTNGADPFDPSIEWTGYATDTFDGLGRHGNADPGPAVVSTTPANGAAGVALDANVQITFSEPVNVSGAWYDITCASGMRTATVSGGPTAFTLDPTSDFAFNEACTVTVLAANVTDQDSIDPPDTMAANYVFTFNTVAPAVRIHDIQAAAHISPKVGQTVSGVAGVVTTKTSNGFWMQDPSPDADDATSEGIFVFTTTAPTVSVGDAVTVSGRVQEFRPGGTGLTITEIATPTLSVTSTGNPLPPAIKIGAGGRVPPTSVIEDDAAGDVETSGVFDASSDGIDFWESLEGMRVDLGMVVITGPSPFDELSVLADNGAGATGRTARGGIAISASDKNPEKVVIRGIGFNMPDANTGDHFTAPIVGVVGYDFNNFMVEVPTPPTRVADGVTREITGLPGPDQLTIATFNVENLDPGDPTFGTMAELIVDHLRSPDILSLEEIQDNDGETNSGTVDATVTLTKLHDAVLAAGGPDYRWRLIDPVNNQDGGAPGGNIRQAFFFRTDRGVAFIDRPGATSTTANAVVNNGGVAQLQYSPGRIDPTNSAFTTSRKPLAGEFTYNGHHLIVIANHWNSKGGDDPLWGHRQPPVLSSEVQRMQQSQVVRDFVRSIYAVDPNSEVVVLGDLNDFEFSNPLMNLKGAPLSDLIETLPMNERYTYVFEGNSQTLDHILVSPALVGAAITDVVHVNSEFWDQASDHEPQVATLFLSDEVAPDLVVPADVTRSTGAAATTCAVFVSDADLGTATATDNTGGPVTITRGGVPVGNHFPLGDTFITYTATDAAGNTSVAMQKVTVIDDTKPTITAPADATYASLAEVPAGTASATDNCGTPAITLSETNNGGAGTAANPLVITRTFTATDGSGNTASAVQTITVIDNVAPTITAPASLTIRTSTIAGNTCAATVTLGDATAHDNSGLPVTIGISGVPAGNVFLLGTTTITYTATDAAGNTATATQTVTVVDDTPPTVVAPPSASYQLRSQVPAGSAADASATDNCGPVSVTLSESDNGGAGSPSSPLVITRMFTATDTSGNTSTGTQVITVADTIAPTITAPADVTFFTGPASTTCAVQVTAAMLGTPTASDNSGSVTITGPGAGAYPVGPTTVTWTATDPSGNATSASQRVTVIDNTPPSLTAPANLTRDATAPLTFISDADLGTAAATDNCGFVSVTRTGVPAGNLFPRGTTTLTYRAIDGSNNTTTRTQTVTIGLTETSLCTLTRALVTNADIGTSLCAKLSAAAAALARGNVTAHDNILEAYMNEVQAQRGKAIASANADILIALADML